MSNTTSNLDVNSTAKPKQDEAGPIATKVCKKCGQDLPLSHYSKYGNGNKLRNDCKACCAKYARKQDGPTRACYEAKRRAKAKGLDYDIDADFIRSIDTDICPYLMTPMEWTSGQGNRAKDHSKSIDRIDSRKGYTRDNVIVCSFRANTILSNATLPEISLIAHNFRRILSNQ